MLGAASRTRSQAASTVAEPSQTNPVVTENTAVDSALGKHETSMARADVERENEAPTTIQSILPLSSLDLDTAICLRWALRDIKAKRTNLTPVSPSDLKTLIEMGLVEIREDAPMLSNEAHQALDQ